MKGTKVPGNKAYRSNKEVLLELGVTILKFSQFYSGNLKLQEEDKLCSSVVDVTFYPLTYCLRKTVAVKMRILEECINRCEIETQMLVKYFNWCKQTYTQYDFQQISPCTGIITSQFKKPPVLRYHSHKLFEQYEA